MATRPSKLDPYADKIGILPDKLIADMAGVSGENVRVLRKRRDIPARWRGEGELMPNEAAILEEAGLLPSPAPKKAPKKRKAAKPKAKKAPAIPKAKKAPAKTRKPSTKKPKVEPVVEAAPVVEEAAVIEPVVEAEPTPEPILEATPEVEAAPAPVLEQEPVVEAEPTPEPVIEVAPEPVVEPVVEEVVVAAPKPAPIKRHRKSKMDPFMDKIGVLSDREVGDLAGVSSENVRAFRKRRGIPAQWRGEAKQIAVASAPKAKAAPKAATKRKPRRGKLTPFLDQVGTVPDARIAEMAGTSPANVRAFRLRHDIPARWRGEGELLPVAPAPVETVPVEATLPTPAPAPAKPGRKPRRGKLTPFLEHIGILSDSVIGDKAETTAQNVRAFRIRHGIPARWRGEGEPLPNEEAILALQAGPQAIEDPTPVIEPVPAPVVEAAPVAEPVLPVDDDLPPEADDVLDLVPAAETAVVLKGYKVRVVAEDQKTTFVVTGADIVEAAQNAVAALAQRATEGEIVELKFLANMLGA